MTAPPDDDRYLSTAAAARFTGFSAETLKHWRWRKKGPPYSRVDGTIRYRLADLRAFIEAADKAEA